MRNWIIVALVGALALSAAAFALAQSSQTANVEVRVWEDVNDPLNNYISARPEGGSWRTLGTIPLPLDDGVSSSGRFRYGDITLAVPLPDTPTTTTPTETPQPDIEITNLRCGRWIRSGGREITGTFINNSGKTLDSVTFYGASYRGGQGEESDTDYVEGPLSPGDSGTFEIWLTESNGEECKLTAYKYTVTTGESGDSTLEVNQEYCSGDWFAVTVRNNSSHFIEVDEVKVAYYGTSGLLELDRFGILGTRYLQPGADAVLNPISLYLDEDITRCEVRSIEYRQFVHVSHKAAYQE